MENEETKKGSSLAKIIVPVIAIIAIVAAGYFYMQVKKLQKDPQAQAVKETNKLISQVSKLTVLPEGEIPTIATVSDKEKLKEQPFFDKAQDGDKVLIYTNAKKAILYSVSMNKILEIAPLNIGAQPVAKTPAPTATPATTTTTTPAKN